MATALTLAAAAGQAFDNLFTLWSPGGNTLQTRLTSFVNTLLPVFPDSNPISRPVSLWLILIGSVANQMPSVTAPATVPYEQLVTAADYLYRCCWLAAKPTSTSPAITTAQQTATLAAYNLYF